MPCYKILVDLIWWTCSQITNPPNVIPCHYLWHSGTWQWSAIQCCHAACHSRVGRVESASTDMSACAPQAAISMLKQDYKETPTLDNALELAVKVLYKTLDSTKLTSEKGERQERKMESVFVQCVCACVLYAPSPPSRSGTGDTDPGERPLCDSCADLWGGG